MHTPFYRLVFRDAWHAAWRNKRLWLLGLLSAFWGIAGLRMVSGWKTVIFSQLSVRDIFVHNLSTGIPLGPVGLPAIASFVTLLAIVAMLLWVVTASRGGIFWALAKTGNGEAGEGTVGQALQMGTKKFWQILFIHIVANLGVALLFVLSVLVAMGLRHVGMLRSFLGGVSVVIFTIAALFVGIVSIFTTIGVVAEDLSIHKAWNVAWRHLHRHWIVALETVGLLYLMSALAAGVMLLIGVALALPVFMVLIATSLFSSQMAMWLIALPMAVIILCALMVLGAAYSTFEAAAWTHLYRRTREATPIPTIMRIFNFFRVKFGR